MFEIKDKHTFDSLAYMLSLNVHHYYGSYATLISICNPIFYIREDTDVYSYIDTNDISYAVSNLKGKISSLETEIRALEMKIMDLELNSIILDPEDKAYLLLKYKGK